MRIVFYTPITLRNGAGAEQWQMTVAPVLQEEFGHTVEIIACNYGASNISLAEVRKRLRGVSYTELPIQNVLGFIPLPSPTSKQLLRKRLTQADAVHYVFGFVGHDLLVKQYVNRDHTQIYTGFHAPILTSSTFHNLYVKTISRHLTLPSSKGFFVFNPDQAAMVHRWGLTQPSTSIAGCVDLQRFTKPPHAPSTTVMELVRVGRVAWDKGADLLCDALRQWFQEDPTVAVHVTLVGSGPQEEVVTDLVRAYPDKVTHVSHTPDTEALLRSAHAGLVPSREETFGIAMIEALATGIPVLATAVDGPRRVITGGKNGWLVQPNSAIAYLAGLKKMYALWKKDPVQWEKNRDAIRASVEQYSPHTIAERIDHVLRAKSV